MPISIAPLMVLDKDKLAPREWQHCKASGRRYFFYPHFSTKKLFAPLVVAHAHGHAMWFADCLLTYATFGVTSGIWGTYRWRDGMCEQNFLMYATSERWWRREREGEGWSKDESNRWFWRRSWAEVESSTTTFGCVKSFFALALVLSSLLHAATDGHIESDPEDI